MISGNTGRRLLECALWAALGLIWMRSYPQGLLGDWLGSLTMGGIALLLSAGLTRLKLGWERRKRTSPFPRPSWRLFMGWRRFTEVSPQMVLSGIPGTLSLSGGMLVGNAIFSGRFCEPAVWVALMAAGHWLGLVWFLKRGNEGTETIESLPRPVSKERVRN